MKDVIENILSNPALSSFPPLLLDAALKSFVLLAVASVVALLWRRASAAARHSVWFVAVASLLFLPLFSVIVPGWQKPLWRLSTNAKEGNELTLAIEFTPKSTAPLGDAARQEVNQPPPTRPQSFSHAVPFRWLVVVSFLWLSGAVAVMGYMAVGWLRLRAVCGRARNLADKPLLNQLCQELKIGREVTLCESQESVMPMTWGWLRPVVLLPAEANQWAAERKEVVLRHELAHVKRWDCLSQFIARIACAIYWFNPLVWWAERRMCVERERACDDMVLEGGWKASDYASHLLEVARSFRRLPRVTAIAMARSAQLKTRIGALVDQSRARRTPRAFVLSLLWGAMLSLVATIAAQKLQNSDSEAEALRKQQIKRLQEFAKAKEKHSQALLDKAKEKISGEYKKFFDAAIKGDGQTVTNMYESFKRRHPQYERFNKDATDQSLNLSCWSPVLEISMAYYDVLAGEPNYIQTAVDEIIRSIPRESIYFGGTDPGRALPTAFCNSHADADPFFVLTQNALADENYLEYLRKTYGSRIYTLSKEDSDRCYEEYSADARKRLDHDTKFPNEPRQVRPGEDVRLVEGKVRVIGQVAVMAVNGLMTKLIFDRNEDRDFYVEESFPLDWMYPHLEPHGLIMKINREPLKKMPEEAIRRDHDYWQNLVDRMIGKWLTDETSVQTIAEFVEKVYARKDLSGFQGDPRFAQNGNAQRMFSKWRSSIAGVYSWRIPNSKSPEEQERMIKEADFGFRQAYAICPSSPEAIYRYINLLIARGRVDDSIRLAEASIKISPSNQQLKPLLTELTELQRIKRAQGK